MKENENGILSYVKNHENDMASLACEVNDKDGFWDKARHESTIFMEDFRNGNGNEAGDSVLSCTIPSSKGGWFEDKNLYMDQNGNGIEEKCEDKFKTSVTPPAIHGPKMEVFENTELYTDKNVMQYDLSKSIICERENTYQVVKDICIDEGVIFKDKILIENANERGICTIISNQDKDSSMTKEPDDIEYSSADGSESSSGNDFEDDAHEFGSKEEEDTELFVADALKSLFKSHFDDEFSNNGRSLDLVQTDDIDHNEDKRMDDVLREKSVTGMSLMQNFTKQRSLNSFLESPISNGNEAEKQSGQIPCSEEYPESPALVTTADDSNKRSFFNDLNQSKNVESEIAHLNSSVSADDGRSGNPGYIDHDQPLKTDSEPNHGDGISDSLTVGRESQRCQGESSFSMAGPLSGLITYSGRIAYSGSISLRSDSSTTSTRSFAFPVLQTEWSGSPVRMAKADRRHYRKNRSWMVGFLCCRF
ncbi:hypothetical protein NMG60_11036213 [Bertholletia excelsa]